MNMETWADLMPIFRLLLASLEGFGAVALVNYLKGKLAKLSGKPKIIPEAALLLTFGVCLILALLTLVVEGIVSPQELQTADLVGVFVTIFTVAKVRYDMMRRRQKRTQQFEPDPSLKEREQPDPEEVRGNLF